MSLFKKAIVAVSALALAGPMIANGAAGVVSAAVSGSSNAKTEKVAKPNTSLKVPLRNADNIFNLKLDKQKNGYVLVSNITASGNNVIQKGEKLVVNFNKENVDLDNSSVITQDNAVPFTVQKDADNGTVTYTFTKDVDSGNFVSAIGIATKNLYTTTHVKANFQGSPISIADNNLTSKWQSPETTYSSTGTSTSQQSSYTAGTSQYAMTQAASTSSSYSTTTSYATTQQAGNATTQAGETNGYTPTFDEAEQAVMGRTTFSVAGTATNTETSANQATTNNGSTAKTVNDALPATSNTAAKTSTSTSTTSEANQATPAKDATSTQTDAQATQSDTTGNAASQAAATENSASTTATVEPQTTTSVQASTNASNVIQTPNGKASDPEATLNKVLQNRDTDPNAKVDGDDSSYQSNPQFEKIRTQVATKAPAATAEEQAQMIKTLPYIWNYISNSADQNQVFNFATLLTTGRTAYTTINGVADANSSNILQQQMPTLLKAFGSNLTEDSFDDAMDIDVLLESQVYQDYLAGKYTATSDDTSLDASTAWANMNDHISITAVDSNTDTTGAKSVGPRFYNAKSTLDNLASEALAKQNAEKADKLVVNKDTSANVATTETEDTSNATGSKLFSQIEKDIYGKMGDASSENKAQVLGSLPGILNDLSTNTASTDKTGTTAKYLQTTTDGSKYLITLNTQPITGSSDKYLANLPQVFKAFGDSLKEGDFDKAINMQVMENSQIYQDYKDGKYVPESLVTKKTVDNSSDLLPAILLTILAFPLVALAMGVVTILTAPIWIPLAIITWGVVFAITALPVGLFYMTLGLLLLPSLVLFPIMLIVSALAALPLLVLNLIPIVNLITVPISLVILALTFVSGFVVLSFIPAVLVAAVIVIAGIALPIIMTIGLVIAQVIAGILSLILGGLIVMLLPITALLGIIIAGAFSLLGLIGFALIAGLIIGGVLALIVAGFAVLTVLAGGFAGVIGLGLIAGMAVVILGYLAFLGGGILAGIATFLILLVLMPQFLVLNFMLWFIGLGFMAVILPDLAIPSLYLALLIGGLMMLFFIPGLLIALSWPFWAGLVLAISIPIVELAALIALPFSFIPLFGWIADAIVGVIILIQAIALTIAVVAPIVIGVLMMTVGIIGFDIAAAAALVLELIKKKQKAERAHVNIDASWRLPIHPVGFWTKSDPLANALA
ncbi:MFS transporter [Companilactobacillus ginsenosidimutans]|uniref:Uncharacterized protein n=1 Tax=Companilactobacillus ginsenosidimutans TaxID=1007676 RepID=A0A0H4QLZ6_9LACO|nr:MFS transporter [Companilactobacillus ginsenosidimutans]AKP67728.1 hypothetical protein ABM34_09445 [Companilactobacillus ginsenosidimutans]